METLSVTGVWAPTLPHDWRVFNPAWCRTVAMVLAMFEGRD
jgi:hypothetical protein